MREKSMPPEDYGERLLIRHPNAQRPLMPARSITGRWFDLEKFRPWDGKGRQGGLVVDQELRERTGDRGRECQGGQGAARDGGVKCYLETERGRHHDRRIATSPMSASASGSITTIPRRAVPRNRRRPLPKPPSTSSTTRGSTSWSRPQPLRSSTPSGFRAALMRDRLRSRLHACAASRSVRTMLLTVEELCGERRS